MKVQVVLKYIQMDLYDHLSDKHVLLVLDYAILN